ncbi:hypothetical protein [Hymenobacter cellulosivorans]|uniref:Transposase n=1 Tax=Hymenobacter cellulosivorans TaxID=2932249 RepID=A0ABY4F9A7_9BACT|nr:hypothetical protein [Hymenobacter cellulosivorans]UOQ53113.1 hypothetical protein MUN80_25690 [Hymenobacter cellulosivorans]
MANRHWKDLESGRSSNRKRPAVIAPGQELPTANLNETKWIVGLRIARITFTTNQPLAMLFTVLLVTKVIIPPPLG